jgi:hypothetical protein
MHSTNNIHICYTKHGNAERSRSVCNVVCRDKDLCIAIRVDDREKIASDYAEFMC